jgi:ABC-type transport system involved in multi-copper enzyme maturation permease subunit
MLWYKSWLETRWRFIAGVALLVLSAIGTVLVYPQLTRLIGVGTAIDAGGALGRQIKEGIEISSTFRGYIWWQAFRQSLLQIGTLFAVLLGTGGLLTQSGGTILYTLSLPVSRLRVLAVRAGAGLAEWLIVAFAAPLAIVAAAPLVGEHYGIVDALAHGVCLFVGGTAFYSLAFLLSTSFSDLWRPLLIACAVALVLSMAEYASGALGRYGVFAVMRGEGYFRNGHLPWPGLLITALASAGLLYAAAVNTARRDF